MLNIYRDEVEPEGNNCFSINFKAECEKLEESRAKHELLLSLGIMPRNPIITRGDYNPELLYSPLKIILKYSLCTQKEFVQISLPLFPRYDITI